jgi:D-sedoheptulose 7-phosphate isomerase
MNTQFISEKYIKSSLSRTSNLLNEISSSSLFIQSVIDASNLLTNSIIQNQFIFLAGNGGSAAHSQHFAAELVSRFNFDRNPLPAVALTTDSSVTTAISNDYGFEKVFERQIDGLSKEGDVFIGLSTSGKSPNILQAFLKAKEKNLKTIAISGINGIESFDADVQISIPTDNTPLIQEMHGITSHLLCDLIEKSIFDSKLKN